MSDYGNAMTLSHHLTSEDSDSDHTLASGSPAPRPLSSRASQLQASASEGPGSSSATKKPRGRPPGSKNKPKPPLVITRESESAMKPVVLEISAGSDVIEMVTSFARRRRVGVTLLSGTGTVSNVTLRHPMSSNSHAPGSLISLHGPFHLLSLWGSFMGFNTNAKTAAAASKQAAAASAPVPAQHGFGITLSGAQGQVFGGVVGGKVVAAGPVVVVAATFLNPPTHRLPPPQEEREGGSGADEDEEEHQTGGRSIAKEAEAGTGPVRSCVLQFRHCLLVSN
ncbi:AT-hook motif nuclear-localized protein 29-like [Punica granatum]|uniref:AT-hook motif nuclear-localized protein 29-like n=1 Tax=Punica granatum TaxID=22663 RepID=A0A6P8E9X2_PUNGR|nr:AT-hook motif nuclear-localized protein 29-like [Punica granatum]